MGLFHRSSPSLLGSSDNVWANTDNSGRREENDSAMTVDCAASYSASPPSASSNRSVEGLSRRVQLLERQLQRKESFVSQLLKTVEAQEKVQSERINLLERQLERLVELSSARCAHEGKSLIPSPGPHQKKQRNAQAESPERQARMEVSVLQELLSRMLAEKDRLAFENANLKALVRQRSGQACPSCVGITSKMPPTIGELDNMMNKKTNNKKRQSKMPPNISELDNNMISKKIRKKRGGKHDSWGNLFGDSWGNLFGAATNASHNEREEENSANNAPLIEEEGHSVLYKISCRGHRKDRSHLKYVGAYTANSADSSRELSKIVKLHIAQVWRMVQEDKGEKGDDITPPSVRGKECYEETINEFPSSPLARYLAHKCARFSNKKEMVRWFSKNIKVELPKERSTAIVV